MIVAVRLMLWSKASSPKASPADISPTTWCRWVNGSVAIHRFYSRDVWADWDIKVVLARLKHLVRKGSVNKTVACNVWRFQRPRRSDFKCAFLVEKLDAVNWDACVFMPNSSRNDWEESVSFFFLKAFFYFHCCRLLLRASFHTSRLFKTSPTLNASWRWL